MSQVVESEYEEEETNHVVIDLREVIDPQEARRTEGENGFNCPLCGRFLKKKHYRPGVAITKESVIETIRRHIQCFHNNKEEPLAVLFKKRNWNFTTFSVMGVLIMLPISEENQGRLGVDNENEEDISSDEEEEPELEEPESPDA